MNKYLKRAAAGSVITTLSLFALYACGGGNSDTVAADPIAPVTPVVTVDPNMPDDVRFQWFGYTNHHVQMGKVGVLMDTAFKYQGTAGNPAITPLVLSALRASGATFDYMVLGHIHPDHSIDSPEVQIRTGAKYYGTSAMCQQASTAGAACEVIKGGESLVLSPYVTMYPFRFIHGIDCPGALAANGGTETIAYLFKVQTKKGVVAFTLNDSGIGGNDAKKDVVINGVNLGSADGNFRRAMESAGLTKLDFQTVGPEKRSSTHAATWLPQYNAKILFQTHIATGSGLVAGVQRQYNLLEGLHYKYSATDSPQLMRVLAKFPGTKFVTPDNYFDAWTISVDGFQAVPNEAAKRTMGLPLIGPGSLPQSPTNIRSRSPGDPAGIDCPADEYLFSNY